MRIYMLSPLWTVFYKKLKIWLILVLLPIFHYCNGTKSPAFCPGWEKPACPHYLYPPQPPLQLLAAPLPKAPTSPPSSNAWLLRLRLGRLVGEINPHERTQALQCACVQCASAHHYPVGSWLHAPQPQVRGNKGRPRVLVGRGVSSVRTHTNSTRLFSLSRLLVLCRLWESLGQMCMYYSVVHRCSNPFKFANQQPVRGSLHFMNGQNKP